MTRTWDREVDVLVAGSGAAGMTAAIAAADAGLSTLIVESTDRWGGTTMRSGGGLWMPNNPIMKRLGIRDSREEALTYLEASIGPVTPRTGELAGAPRGVRRRGAPRRRHARAARRALGGVEGLPRLLPRPAGRQGGPRHRGRAVRLPRLGDWQRTSRIGDAIPVPLKTDDVWLLSRAWSTPSGFMRGARFVFRTLGGLLTGRKLVGMGGGLMLSLGADRQAAGHRAAAEHADHGARQGRDGRVDRRRSSRRPTACTVRARHGVILGAGGFARNTAWREKYHGIPGYTSAAEGDLGTGDPGRQQGRRRARPHGRRVVGRLGPVPEQAAAVRAQRALRPVQHRGRPVRRALPQRVRELHRLRPRTARAQHRDPGEPVVAHRRARHRQRYLFGAMLTGGKSSSARTASTVTADTLEELAAKMGIDPATLPRRSSASTASPARGVDEDFGRGRTATTTTTATRA